MTAEHVHPETVTLRLEHDSTGQLILIDKQGARHAVEPVRCFPLSDPDRWIALCDRHGHEVARVEDLAELPPAMREALEQELSRREFVPRILRILNVPPDAEPTEWHVETDRGVTRFTLNSNDDVRKLSSHRALVIDSQGVRYLIGDVRQLDPLSRRTLERFL